jgi:hypothetical protein
MVATAQVVLGWVIRYWLSGGDRRLRGSNSNDNEEPYACSGLKELAL